MWAHLEAAHVRREIGVAEGNSRPGEEDNGREKEERLPIIPQRFFDWPHLIAIADEIAHPRPREPRSWRTVA